MIPNFQEKRFPQIFIRGKIKFDSCFDKCFFPSLAKHQNLTTFHFHTIFQTFSILCSSQTCFFFKLLHIFSGIRDEIPLSPCYVNCWVIFTEGGMSSLFCFKINSFQWSLRATVFSRHSAQSNLSNLKSRGLIWTNSDDVT